MIALLVAISIVAAPEEPARGRLCIDGACADAAGTSIAVAPADEERSFVWTSADAAVVRVGVVPAKSTSIDLAASASANVHLTLSGDPARGWPAAADIVVKGAREWRWTLDAEAARRLRTLTVPRGAYAITIDAEHHQTWSREKIAAGGEEVRLGAVRLLPQPVVRGVIVDDEGAPIADAAIALSDASVCAMSDARGAFACELPKKIEGELALVVTKSGFGPRSVELQRRSGADVVLGKVVLRAAFALDVRVERPEAGPARVSLRERVPHGATLATLPIHERVDGARFEAAPGSYFVVVEGVEPLERLAVEVEVRGGEDAHERIVVEPYRLIGSVRFGDEPLDGAIEISHPAWREKVSVAAGSFGGKAWQPGVLNARITGSELDFLGHLQKSPKLGDDPSRWEIHIARRVIEGRIIDAETKRPIAKPAILVSFRVGQQNGSYPVKADDNGRYRVLVSRPGTYMLLVQERDYVPHQAEFHVTEADESRTHDIALERGVVQKIEFLSAAGAPLVSPSVLEGVRPDHYNPAHIWHVDAVGRLELRGRPGESRTLYVLPREGSFAVVRVTLPRSSETMRPLQVVLPPPLATLRLRGAGRGFFLVRYNGEFLPNAVWARLDGRSREGEDVIQARLPVGVYEIWKLDKPEDEEPIVRSGGTVRPPVRVDLPAGEQAVELGGR